MKNRNMTKKIGKKQRKGSRKGMKGGFWPFTSNKPIDPNQPQPPKKTVWEILFGSKKPVEDTTKINADANANIEMKPNPLIASNENLAITEPEVAAAPVIVEPVTEKVAVEEPAVIPQGVENKMMYRGEGGKKRRMMKKKTAVKFPRVVVVLHDKDTPMHNETSTNHLSNGGKKRTKKMMKKRSRRYL